MIHRVLSSLRSLRSLPTVNSRTIQSSTPHHSSLLTTSLYPLGTASKYIENKEASGLAGIVQADNAVGYTKLYHFTSVGLLAVTPCAFALSPSTLSMPLDWAMSILIPVHAHIGMNNVISDYIPKPQQPVIRLAWLGAAGLMCLGLIRLNVEGPGITETIKTFWRQPKSSLKEVA
uniref:Succinate dehydrogenase [ubiquinone] cytochrome b small subunit n=1 Tax=Albugo laibachii Nc14 TaxID=890382 RepID=F0WYT9_9STRA|nr:conserved hypothetical protein [Albugo laibachii Nc14]|eukprot:CCA26648.1 conserved hypothetical protein [Albugo laibachii Nc14]